MIDTREVQVQSTGQTPNSQLVESFAPSCIAQNGFISVDQHLRIVQGDPEERQLAGGRVFAIGDVADTGELLQRIGMSKWLGTDSGFMDSRRAESCETCLDALSSTGSKHLGLPLGSRSVTFRSESRRLLFFFPQRRKRTDLFDLLPVYRDRALSNSFDTWLQEIDHLPQPSTRRRNRPMARRTNDRSERRWGRGYGD